MNQAETEIIPNYEIALETKALKVNPWVRFFARKIDLIIISLLLDCILQIIFPSYESFNMLYRLLLNTLISCSIWVFIESIFLTYWGTTLGKFIFNLRVTDLNNSKLNFNKAFHRSLNVWIKGIGFGLPPISFFTLTLSYGYLDKLGATTWDKNKFTVTQGNMGVIRLIIAGLSILFVIASILEDRYIFRNEIGAKVVKEEQTLPQKAD